MIRRLIIGLCLLIGFPTKGFSFDCDAQLENITRKITKEQQTLGTQSLDDIDVVKEHLRIMCDLDQDARKLFIECDSPTTRGILSEVEACHTNHLKKILKIHGWMTISKFGKEADHQAWLLVQHADHDPDFQEKCLAALEQLLSLHETNKEHYAYLYDRVALKSEKFGQKQRYGTQAIIMNGELSLSPFEGTPEDVKRRRQEMGLEPLEDYMEHLKELYKQ